MTLALGLVYMCAWVSALQNNIYDGTNTNSHEKVSLTRLDIVPQTGQIEGGNQTFPHCQPMMGQPMMSQGQNNRQCMMPASGGVGGMNIQKKPQPLNNFHNAQFKNDVKWNVRTFLDFIKSNPDVKEGFNELISNYGIIDSGLTKDSGLTSPDPDYIIRSLDEALSIHASFKKFIRKLLLGIDGHILEKNDRIKTLVRRMRTEIGELNNLRKNIGTTRSALRKSEFLKEYAALLMNMQGPKNEFINDVSWLMKVQDGLEGLI